MTDNHTVYLAILLAFVTGISVGSFVTMASYRLVLGEDIVFKPSYCPQCHAPLTWRELFPLFSWLFQRGKCRHCATPIHVRYPLIELSLGLIFAALVAFYGLTVTTLFLALLATELLILIVTDFEHYIIPDSIQIVVLISGLAYGFYRHIDPFDTAASIATGLTIGLALHYGYLKLRKKDALGWGDVKFLAAAGAWLPLAAFVPFLFLAGLIGTMTGILWKIRSRGELFPFGPALACSLFINVLFPDILHRIIT